MLKAKSEEQVLDAMEFARVRGCPVFVLGGGSNVVIADSGFPGLVVKIELTGIQDRPGAEGSWISAAAGVAWDALVRHCIDRKLAGIECLSGIPGTVGGAPIQNINAYGQHAGDVVLAVIVFDRHSRHIVELTNADCRFSYRSSIFNTSHRNRHIILRVDFTLQPNGPPCMNYADIQRAFTGCDHTPGISDVREAVLRIRAAKGMILADDDADTKSVGSFFKNPVLSCDAAGILEAKARACGFMAGSDSIPRFEAGPGLVKLPAAWLIEHAGFRKGYTHGKAGISGKHALAIVNRGGASAREILELMRRIQDRVEETFEVKLPPEPVFVGFED
jgi:UDP-N-acetylmuramate dehydrogenase